MKAIQAYLLFDGTCREAMNFYAEALGASVAMHPFSGMPGGSADDDRVMHARLEMDGAVLMASDCQKGMTVHAGDNFSVSLDCESVEEEQRIFAALSQGGTVKMELQDTFWGSHFGMMTDRFGINWMLSYELPKMS